MISAFGKNKKIPAVHLGDLSRSYSTGGSVLSESVGISQGNAGQVIDDIYKSIAEATKALGGTTDALRIWFSSNTGKQGSDPRFSLGVWKGDQQLLGVGQHFGQEIPADQASIALAVSKALLAGLQASELPQYLSKFFNSIVIDGLDQTAINNVFAFATGLKELRLVLTSTPLEVAAKHVEELNAALGASATSIEAWKTQFLTAIDAGTNPQAVEQWQALGAAIQQVADITAQAAEQAAQAAQAQWDSYNAWSLAQQAAVVQAREASARAAAGVQAMVIGALQGNVARARGAYEASLGVLRSVYERESSQLTGRIDTLAQFSAGLFTSTPGALSPSQQYGALRGQLTGANVTTLGPQFLQASLAMSRTQGDYLKDVAKVMQIAGTEQNIAQAQFDVMKEQVEKLIDINESVVSLSDALLGVRRARAGVIESQASLASFAGVDSSQALRSAARSFLRRNGPDDMSTDELLAEIKALRQEVAGLRRSSEQTASSSKKTSDLLRNVTRDGQSLLTETV